MPVTCVKPSQASAEADSELVVQFIKSCGSHGATTDEIATHYGRPRDSFSPRIAPLKRAGVLSTNGLTRTTAQRCQAEVLVLASDPTARPAELPKITYKEIHSDLSALVRLIKAGLRSQEQTIESLDALIEKLSQRL